MKPTATDPDSGPLRLWYLSRLEFNKWRQLNDLPELLVFFKALPRFAQWQESQNVTDTDVITIDHTSRLFAGSSERYIVDFTRAGDRLYERERTLSVADVNVSENSAVRGDVEIHSNRPFVPYFKWLRDVQKTTFFRIPGDLNNQFVDNIEYRTWQGGTNLAFTRASLFYSHKVLKLGGVDVTPNQLDERNLDFVDLDGLRIRGSGWARQASVAYTSCRNIEIREAEKAFLTFERCTVDELSISGSRIQDLHFVDCNIIRPTLTDSRLFRVSFSRSILGAPDIANCDLVDFAFDSTGSKMTFQGCADLYKRLRVAFQQKGERQQASQYYYRERMAELLANFSPLIPREPGFPFLPYQGTRAELREKTRAGQFTEAEFTRLSRGNLLAYLRLLSPLTLLRFVAKKFRILGQVLDWSVWGFGERPARVFPWMACVLAGFAAKYVVLGGKHGTLRGKIGESFYCSAFNFATMGCDEKSSFDSIEGILGAVLLGVMVAGFANRTRY